MSGRVPYEHDRSIKPPQLIRLEGKQGPCVICGNSCDTVIIHTTTSCCGNCALKIGKEFSATRLLKCDICGKQVKTLTFVEGVGFGGMMLSFMGLVIALVVGSETSDMNTATGIGIILVLSGLVATGIIYRRLDQARKSIVFFDQFPLKRHVTCLTHVKCSKCGRTIGGEVAARDFGYRNGQYMCVYCFKQGEF